MPRSALKFAVVLTLALFASASVWAQWNTPTITLACQRQDGARYDLRNDYRQLVRGEPEHCGLRSGGRVWKRSTARAGDSGIRRFLLVPGQVASVTKWKRSGRAAGQD